MIELRVATHDDAREMHEFFIKSLFPEEPLLATKGEAVELPDWTVAATRAVIPQGRSIVALDATTGRIVGAALNDDPPQEFPYIYTHDENDVKFQKLFLYMEKVSQVLEKAPKAAEIRFLAVDETWRGKGVAQSIVEASTKIISQSGFEWIKIYCTSHYSGRLLDKMGWTKLYSLSYEDYSIQHDSTIVIPPLPHTHCHLYVRHLKSED